MVNCFLPISQILKGPICNLQEFSMVGSAIRLVLKNIPSSDIASFHPSNICGDYLRNICRQMVQRFIRQVDTMQA